MKKILGKKKPPEEVFVNHVLPDDGQYWHCSSHKEIFEPGDIVLIDGKKSLCCPLDGCKKTHLTFDSKKGWEENYDLEAPLR